MKVKTQIIALKKLIDLFKNYKLFKRIDPLHRIQISTPFLVIEEVPIFTKVMVLTNNLKSLYFINTLLLLIYTISFKRFWLFTLIHLNNCKFTTSKCIVSLHCFLYIFIKCQAKVE